MSPPADDQDERRGIVFGLTAYLLWGFLTLFWRELHHFNAFELIGWRVLSSTVVMVVVLTVGGRWGRLTPIIRQPALLARVAAAAVLLTTNWTAYVYAVVHDNVIETALGYFIAPLGTMAVGVFVLHERVHRAQRVAIGLGLASVAVLTWSYGRVPWLAVLIAVSWTGYGYLKKRVPLSPVESMGAETFVLAVPAAIVVASIRPLVEHPLPVLNLLFGWLLFHEALPLSPIVGFALVWLALGVLTFDSARRARVGRIRVRAAA